MHCASHVACVESVGENSGKFIRKLVAKKCIFFGNIGLCVPEPISEYVGRNIQSRFFRAVCLDLGSRLLASIKDNRGTGKRRASILPHILTISQHRQIKFLQF